MKSQKKILLMAVLIPLFFFCFCQTVFAECKECVEVAKGKIPAQFIDKSVKALPSGIIIWDIDEAIKTLKKKTNTILWVDTRPKSFFDMGSVKNAELLVCDMKGIPIDEDALGPAISKKRLETAIKKIHPDMAAVTLVFFCQGPKCHRSYDAAIRAVLEYGYPADKVVWFRAGYPLLETHIMGNPKLKKRISK
ncbi:MAG: hypothetical protein QNK29_11375 [Desulfobacterales bacterium]|nr:hypothetical protein [Desulfobacterales bacterium]MDX2512548.1 hypothetical protein [Desulfobacterales bacterium]